MCATGEDCDRGDEMSYHSPHGPFPPGFGSPRPPSPPPRRRPADTVLIGVSGVLFGVAAMNTFALSFVFPFLGDFCGSPDSPPACSSDRWEMVAYLGPLASLAAAGGTGFLCFAWSRRQGWTPWLALLPALLIYGTATNLVYHSWGWTSMDVIRGLFSDFMDSVATSGDRP